MVSVGLVGPVAKILMCGEPTPFAFEADCRHALRFAFVIAGQPWQRADALAEEIVSTALATIGAERPKWREGQPEFADRGDGCPRCGKPLPDERPNRTYCSRRCKELERQRRHSAAYRSEGKRLATCA